MEIDLNSTDDYSQEAAASSPVAVCWELWQACAGPLISLPKKGSLVVYFPQGHLEQAGLHVSVNYSLPAHVVCRVVDVKLQADGATDEVYAQVSLVPQREPVENCLPAGWIQSDREDDSEDVIKTTCLHMFCKTLTASDTSTHGGFSVPRRAAEDCFPPLVDYKQQRPSQELVAKDLHGIVWRFRHIYRGQPRRHLLTTGWSAFVNKKKLVSGDAVLFLRDENRELRLGIRKAAQFQGGISQSARTNGRFNLNTLAAVASAVSTKSVFHIHYSPRLSPSEFIIPYHRFCMISDHSLPIGARFKMRVETEDATDRRYTGMITGVGDIDPLRWPCSKWRCLLVRWDDKVDSHLQNRVSPWEIELCGPFSLPLSSSATGHKRCKLNIPPVRTEFSLPTDGNGLLDFDKCAGFQRVLHGQEISDFESSSRAFNVPGTRFMEMKSINLMRSSISPHNDPESPHGGIGFHESAGFHNVLQGQEMTPMMQGLDEGHADTWAFEHGGARVLYGTPSHGTEQKDLPQVQPCMLFAQVSSPSSVLMFQQATSQTPDSSEMYGTHTWARAHSIFIGLPDASKNAGQKCNSSISEVHNSEKDLGNLSSAYHVYHDYISRKSMREKVDALTREECCLQTAKNSCKLFGFSLSEKQKSVVHSSTCSTMHATYPSFHQHSACEMSKKPLLTKTLANSAGQHCTKVHMQGSIVRRAIDLSKVDGYDDHFETGEVFQYGRALA